ncbi:hypothetical protein [Azohydromonas australica]|jgi:hypothetical protein|uniref:hypothetical protein n=1 Tax=Azohydromonas australica TaxID=364039 RepID=UPI0012EB23BF|nr:hypothetical protein [Azohydromonas australica]
MTWQAPPTRWEQFTDSIGVSLLASLFVILLMACWHFWKERSNRRPEQRGKDAPRGEDVPHGRDGP